MSGLEAPPAGCLNTPHAWSERAALVDPWQAVMWSADGQRERFNAVLAALAPQAGERLLDFGCGLGALAGCLAGQVAYVGYDWAPGMVARARLERPTRTFTDRHPTGRFDLVACVGPFNLSANWSKQATGHTLRHLWDATGCRTLACSLYAGADPDCLVYGDEECVNLGRQMSHDTTVWRHRPNDLLLVVRR